MYQEKKNDQFFKIKFYMDNFTKSHNFGVLNVQREEGRQIANNSS